MGEASRTRWTDERIDDLALEIREMRREMREGFQSLRDELAALRGEMNGLRVETHEDVRSLWTELAATRRWFYSLQVTMVLGFVAVIVQLQLH